ncbi:DUF3352 domain-containing protein [Muricauda sp. 2012CJ35-5]|uniref:DUF3352 domain-containing protein n=1 Tax=Flagellimonas spongiicola TaxID=2942208 RepID=A0ABT0PT64_9FLAO|nr:DUF3352 domain-containing protein [Allomuricauda spongiicola]MCL6274583.1 DUF3352 domain-containing protein [Allomuricauda spongiicola]
MTKKRMLYGFLTFLVIYLCYLAYIFILSPKTNLQSIYLIPKDAVFIIESDKPVESWAKVSESEVWQHLQQNNYFANLTENIQKVDTVFNDNHRLFEFFDDRSLFISIHMISKRDYGIFYVLDLKRIAKLNLLKTYINTLLNDNFTMSKRTYHGQEILEIYDRKSKETIYLAFIKNQLVASYTHTLVEASIDQYQEPILGRDLNFLEINSKIGYEDLFRLYLQYDFLDEYYHRFSTEPNEWVDRVSENLLFSGFHMNLDENNTITADGFTNISADNHNYLAALQRSGKAERGVPQIATDRTALYVSYGFDSFKEFYANFEGIKKQNPEQFENYTQGLQKVEKFLKIDVQENFVSWIGDEIALVQIQSKIETRKNEMALVLKTNDLEEAKRNLDFVLKQIKKKTPVKFKAITYKEHQINFLSIKGFFKLLLGNRFKSFDKPYFTQIGAYVVFSNNPNTLKGMIEDYLAGNTLSAVPEYQSFNTKFKKESSLFAYSNVPLLFDNLKSIADGEMRIDMQKNKDFIVCFQQVGFQLTPEDELFESRLVVNFSKVDPTPTKIEISKPKIQKDTETAISDSVFDLKPIYPDDLTANEFVKNYSNGNIRFEVELKDGLKHGRYREFYKNGAERMTGKFRKDKQVGTWRYYDSEGNQLLKKKF